MQQDLNKLLDELESKTAKLTRFRVAYESIGYDVSLPSNSKLSDKIGGLTEEIEEIKISICNLFGENNGPTSI